jgi:dTDP-4-dehydrorhamnose 3,5-epimerase
MEFAASALPEVLVLSPKIFADERGYLMESFQAAEFAAAGLPIQFAQENTSHSTRGTLRGLHYQLQKAQGKIIRAVSGSVFDVAVDLRRSSATFGRWVAVELSAESGRQIWIPPGFAHGLYTLTPEATVVYRLTEAYAPEWERSLRWDDPQLAIAWPLVHGLPPLLSPRDATAPLLATAEVYP